MQNGGPRSTEARVPPYVNRHRRAENAMRLRPQRGAPLPLQRAAVSKGQRVVLGPGRGAAALRVVQPLPRDRRHAPGERRQELHGARRALGDDRQAAAGRLARHLLRKDRSEALRGRAHLGGLLGIEPGGHDDPSLQGPPRHGAALASSDLRVSPARAADGLSADVLHHALLGVEVIHPISLARSPLDAGGQVVLLGRTAPGPQLDRPSQSLKTGP
mmetsp:Transcript_55431/g.161875  ORF Transcript_55431/g.161875 Transcript_55431/m.161875 type:complete len:216 (-) Transcript_55431:782-1429(-)